MHTILLEEGYPLARRETYLAMIKNSVGSRQYQELYVVTPQGLVDVIGNGDLACAYYVSSLLTLFGFLKGGVHTTVDETVQDLVQSAWKRTQELEEGAILVWESRLCSDNKPHRHIGFCVGSDFAISNSAETGTPELHHITFGTKEDGCPERNITSIYIHSKLWT